MRLFTFLILLLALAPLHAQAEPVSLSYKGLTLLGELQTPSGGGLKDGVILFTHGTLAHGRMETVANIQSALTQRRLNSLAITLSLGLDKRHGMVDCKITHTHKHGDAMDEIGVWLAWLKGKGAGPVTLMGHSRGGNQTAWFASENHDSAVKSVVLLAPATWNAQAVAEGYKKNHKQDLATNLAKARALAAAGQGAQVLKGAGLLYCPDADVTAESFISYYGDDKRKDTPAIVAAIKRPVLVIAGSEDTVVPGLEARMKRASAPGSRTVVLQDAGHFFRDLFAEDIADLVQEFIGH